MSESYFALGPEGYGPYRVEWQNGHPIMSKVGGKAEYILTPGFVDIHIHGAFGIDFMSGSSGDLLKLCELLAAEGYEGFLPTTVTAPQSEIALALSNLPVHDMIWGFHLEGPFISEKHPGAQPVEWIASPDEKGWAQILSNPKMKVITLAPEREGALKLISDLSDRGVKVSMGHSDATYEQAILAVTAGARHTTHTFNAMRGFHHREAGLAGCALLNDDIYAEIIYDRIHVSEAAARLLVKNKPPNRLVAVSDSTLATRLAPGQHISMWGHDCVTSPGEVRLTSNGALAGSAITLKDAFRNLAADFGVETAILACCVNPRLAIGHYAEPNVYLEFTREFELARVIKADSTGIN